MNKKVIFIIAGVLITGFVLGLIFSSGEKPRQKEGKKEVFSFDTADQAIKEGKYFQAKKLLKKGKNNVTDPDSIQAIQDKLYAVNTKLLFSPLKDECSQAYIVKPGDALSKIAKKFDTTVNLIKKANGLASDKIIPGQELKVNTCGFSLLIDKSQNVLFLKRNGEIFKTYTVATGKNGRTPEGDFKIVNKLIKPTWYKTGAVVLPDDPKNILGSRWLGIDKAGYGIHGTTEPENLGRQVTLGCIRMANEDVEELYDIIPVGTEVVIVE